MTHNTPAARNAGPNLLKISKSASLQNLRPAGSGPRTKAVKCMGKENAGAHQAQKRCNCLDHRQMSVAPRPDRTTAALHSQKDFLGKSKIEAD
jgi:hypothetical protein